MDHLKQGKVRENVCIGLYVWVYKAAGSSATVDMIVLQKGRRMCWEGKENRKEFLMKKAHQVILSITSMEILKGEKKYLHLTG